MYPMFSQCNPMMFMFQMMSNMFGIGGCGCNSGYNMDYMTDPRLAAYQATQSIFGNGYCYNYTDSYTGGGSGVGSSTKTPLPEVTPLEEVSAEDTIYQGAYDLLVAKIAADTTLTAEQKTQLDTIKNGTYATIKAKYDALNNAYSAILNPTDPPVEEEEVVDDDGEDDISSSSVEISQETNILETQYADKITDTGGIIELDLDGNKKEVKIYMLPGNDFYCAVGSDIYKIENCHIAVDKSSSNPAVTVSGENISATLITKEQFESVLNPQVSMDYYSYCNFLGNGNSDTYYTEETAFEVPASLVIGTNSYYEYDSSKQDEPEPEAEPKPEKRTNTTVHDSTKYDLAGIFGYGLWTTC